MAPQKPRQRDAAQTRARILAAAIREFTARGFAGARLDAVAQRGKVTKGLIFHYFRTKESLYVAALERMYERLRQRQNQIALAGLGPEEGIRQLAIETFRSFREEPQIVAMMNEENLQKGRHVRRSAMVPSLYNPLIADISRLIGEGARGGIFRADVDPVGFYVALSGATYFYCSNRHTLGAVFGRDLFSAAHIEEYEKLVADMVIAYLKA